eukprot:CAMPEP_0119130392 /NCGR_PEP_ID=MMETSP1310-20130426/7755_1 /TAXON_ID=464262 /ORGANISM="Genus nov. species nov., Strain RCC2339" /LENGTH=425 /DNA_ID=CAMNT_0007120897 /DNA_START=33 /DNA_END=1310 /DNA_ORIENTATION=+
MAADELEVVPLDCVSVTEGGLLVVNAGSGLLVADRCGEKGVVTVREAKLPLAECVVAKPICVMAGGKYVVVASQDKKLRQYDLQGEGPVLPLVAECKAAGNKRIASMLRCQMEGEEFLLTTDRTSEVVAYGLNSLGMKKTIGVGHLGTGWGMQLARNGTQLIVSDSDFRIRVSAFPQGYDIEGFCLGHYGCSTRVLVLRVNGEDVLLSAASDGVVALWDLEAFLCLSTFVPGKLRPDLAHSDDADEPFDFYTPICAGQKNQNCAFLLNSDGTKGLLLRARPIPEARSEDGAPVGKRVRVLFGREAATAEDRARLARKYEVEVLQELRFSSPRLDALFDSNDCLVTCGEGPDLVQVFARTGEQFEPLAELPRTGRPALPLGDLNRALQRKATPEEVAKIRRESFPVKQELEADLRRAQKRRRQDAT